MNSDKDEYTIIEKEKEQFYKMEKEKELLNVEDTAKYLNLGKTKTRELMKENSNVFVVRIGNRSYAHKLLLDKWLLAQVKLVLCQDFGQ